MSPHLSFAMGWMFSVGADFTCCHENTNSKFLRDI